MKATFEIKELAPLNVITYHHVGDYSEIHRAFERLATWAAPKGLMQGKPLMAAIYHDAPCSKPADELSSDACLVVKGDVSVDGEIGKHIINGGKFAVGHFEITMSEFGSAWNQTYEYFMAQGYQCGDGDHYELYLNDPGNDPQGNWLVDICVPIK